MIPLHVHSHYSPMGGIDSPLDLCEAGKQRGLSALAVTDRNGFYGTVRFLEAAAETGLSPIIGCEVDFPELLEGRCVALAENRKGYEALSVFLTQAHRMKEKEAVAGLGHDMIILSDSRPLLTRLRQEGTPAENLYLELSPHHFTQDDVAWAHRQQIPVVATFRVHHVRQGDRFLYRIMQAIACNGTLKNVAIPLHTHLPSPQEVERFFAHLPQAVRNTYRIAERVAGADRWMKTGREKNIIFPSFDGLSEKESRELLRTKCDKGLLWRYRGPEHPLFGPAKERLSRELQVIMEKGFASYFLVVEDIVSRSQRTCGRGSAAASIVSYLLGITHVEPIRHHLFFDRFLNPDREDPPDIDVDFPWDERDAILDYVFAKYPDHSAMVANHITFQGRSAVREVAKVYGIPEGEISHVTKRLTRVRFERLSLSQDWKNIIALASRLDGQLRHLGVHCGGVVITPRPLACYVPVETAAKGVPIIQWEKDQAEEAGLVKIDLLGNRSLAVIRDTLTAVDPPLDYSQLNPIDDSLTREALTRGKTMGIFYVESPATRLLLTKMKSGDFEPLVIASSIIRPAANKWASEFVRRLHGGPFEYPHPLLQEALEESLGIMVYQEQITKTAMALADFSASEGNDLRKVLGKKHKEKKLHDYKKRFFEEARKKGVTPANLNEIWDMIESFSGYSFCKPHSASYALVSFKALYLKCHYPAEFMAALISHQGGFYSPLDYLEEARRMGLTILPPDVNESVICYRGRHHSIRVGLSQVKYLTTRTLEKLLQERERNGPFLHLPDFLKRVSPTFEEAKILVRGRCFGSLAAAKGDSLLSQMWQVYSFYQGEGDGTFSPLRPDRNYSEPQLIRWEYQYLQGPVTFPFWSLYEKELQQKGRIKAMELRQYAGKNVLLFGEKVVEKPVLTSRRQEMAFVSFCDETGLFDAVFFPPAYERYGSSLLLGGAFFLWGLVQEEYDAVQVEVKKLVRMS